MNAQPLFAEFSNLFNVPPPFNMVVWIVAVVFIGGVLAETVKQVRRFADNEADRRLKREMIEIGVSIEEAEQWARLRMSEKKSDDETS